ncbi:MAG: Ig-like domain-containing protein [Chloroflexota bacterium]
MPQKTIRVLLFTLVLLIPASIGGYVYAGGLMGTNSASPNLQQPTPTASPTSQPPRPEVAYIPVKDDDQAPIVIQRSPRRGETLLPDGSIELFFDRPMNQDTVADALTLQLAAETPVPVSGKITWLTEQGLRFTPTDKLARDKTFDVILTQDALGLNDVPLREPYTFRFMSAGFLEVAQMIPAPASTDVEIDSTITVIFNRPVVPLTNLAQMEDFPQPLTFSPAVKGTGEWLNTSIYIFKPEEPLAGGTTYTAQVEAGLADISGAILADDVGWQFHTVPPQISWVSPSDNSTQVSVDTTVSVTFNQPIDLDSARDAFSLATRGILGTAVEGEFTVLENTLTFTPSQKLEFDQTYILEVKSGVTASAGGEGMTRAFTSRFTTVPLPEIISTSPQDGEQNAHPYTDFRITFNAPIDPDTVMANLEMTPALSPTQVYTYFSTYDNTFTLNFGPKPATDYTVVISDGIADPYGNTIPKGRTVDFRTDNLPPNFRLQIPQPIGTYDADQPATIIVAHTNINLLKLNLYRLETDRIKTDPWRWQNDVVYKGDRINRWNIPLTSADDQQAFSAINLTDTENGTLEPGLYLLEASSPEVDRERRHRYLPRHVLVVSDLQLTLKTGPKEALVWATDLATGQPVSDLAIQLYEQEQTIGSPVATDQDGVARFSIREHQYVSMAASLGRFGAVGVNWGNGISSWDFGLGEGEYSQNFRSYIYTDRPIYRPGQTIKFKGVIRAENDVQFRLPDLGKVQVMIRDAAWNEIYNDTHDVSDLGTFHGEIVLEEGAALGPYNIAINFNDQYFEESFQVAAYRAPEFEVLVNPADDEIQRGADISATLEARYLFGGPLGSADISWNLLAETYRFKPPWGGRYDFSDNDDPYACFDCWWWQPHTSREPILNGSGQTEPDGSFTVNLDGIDVNNALDSGARRLVLEATVTGPDNQVLSGRESIIVHPGPYYIGLSPQKYVSDAGKDSNIDVVVVDWNGERLPEKEIKVEFYQREWINTFIEYDRGGGYWNWETKETLVDETTVSTDELGEAVASFIPPEGGSYHIVAMPANPDTDTQAIRSSIFIWVAGENYVSWRRENHDRITLISDKSSYNIGETAEILIPSPFEGPHSALITIERGRIIRHEVIELQSNSHIYEVPITEADIPNIYISAVLVKGRTADTLADFKMGILPVDVDLASKKLSLQIEADPPQAEPGSDVIYTITALTPDGDPAVGTELSLDVVDKGVLNLQPRGAGILDRFYARRALAINTAATLNVSANRLQEALEEDFDIETAAAFGVAQSKAASGGFAADDADAADMAFSAVAEEAAPAPTALAVGRAQNVAPPAGVEIREEFADTALWEPLLITDQDGQVEVTVTLPDNLTTWVMRGIGLTRDTTVGTETSDLVATKPLLIRPVAPRFFVVDDRSQLAANVNNNTDDDLSVDVTLSAEGIGISNDTPPVQTVEIPARSEAKVTWNVRVDDVTEAQLIFSAVSGDFADASKPRLSTGPDGSLRVLRYTTPDIVGTAGQLIDGGSRTEAIVLPSNFDERRGELTVQLDPSLAAGIQDGLRYLEHFEYECTEQTVSRFLPNILTFNALQSLGIENEDLAEKLPSLVDTGLERLYLQQNPDGGWGWWHNTSNPRSNAHVSGYVVFALLKAEDAGIKIRQEVLARGLNYLQSQLISVRDYKNVRNANQQAWLLYVLAEGDAVRGEALDVLYENRDKTSHYARAYLAQALWLEDAQDARIKTLLSDINNSAILSATGAHWEEDTYDWWAMNTDTRSTAIILDTLTKLDPTNELIPNVVRWLMVARRGGIWETTQETAWSLIALTDWMVETGELDADYAFDLILNDEDLTSGTATRQTVQESTKIKVPVADLVADAANALTVARTDGNGRLYYTAHLEVYQPVEDVEPADRGIIVSRRYSLANCEDGLECPEVREAKLGDVIRVDLTIVAPNDLYYLILEDPLPAGGEAIDTGLATTSLLALDPQLNRQSSQSRYWWWWRWYSRSELRDEKVVLFADFLNKGTYEYSYTFRTTLPGDYHVLPTVVQEMYFPEVFGRSDGRLLSIGE